MSFTSLLIELGLSPTLAWFILGFFLFILELLNPSAFIFFFGFGAWTVSATISCVDLSSPWQLVLFLMSSLIYLVILRVKVIKYIEKQKSESTYAIEDEHVAKIATVIEDIKPPLPGKVLLNGTHWNARSSTPVKAGEAVQVIGRDNLTLNVKPNGSIN